MKYIFLIVIIFFLSVVVFFQNRDNHKLEKKLMNTDDSLNFVRKAFREHLSKCAFIDINDIQKVSKDGRYITLYHPAQIVRIKRYEHETK